MSNERKTKEIHVENLIIHAKNVEVVEERHNREREAPARDPWGFFWGRPTGAPEETVQVTENDGEKEN